MKGLRSFSSIRLFLYVRLRLAYDFAARPSLQLILRSAVLMLCTLLALLLQRAPINAADYDHVELHCLSGGGGILIFGSGKHENIVAPERSIIIEYSALDRTIVTVDIVENSESHGQVLTSAVTLKDVDVLISDGVFDENTNSYGEPIFKVGNKIASWTFYKFLSDYPTLVHASLSRSGSFMDWQKCYVRSKYRVAR